MTLAHKKDDDLYGYEYGESNATNADKWVKCVNDFFKAKEGYGIKHKKNCKDKIALIFAG